MQFRVEPMALQELLVRSLLHDLAFFHRKDHIRAADGGEPVSNHDCGPSFYQAIQGVEYQLLRGGIESGGRFVEDQNGSVADDGARNGFRCLDG